MQEVRKAAPSNELFGNHDYHLPLPNETEYADDVDFLCLNEERMKNIIDNMSGIFKKCNLHLNKSKTEIIKIKRDEKPNEHWRKCKELGSLLGDPEDMAARKNLARISLNKLEAIWNRSGRIGLKRRMTLYRAFVKPVLLYRSETCALGKADKDGLDSFHRQQLRRVLNVKYPNVVANVEVYLQPEETNLQLEVVE